MISETNSKYFVFQKKLLHFTLSAVFVWLSNDYEASCFVNK